MLAFQKEEGRRVFQEAASLSYLPFLALSLEQAESWMTAARTSERPEGQLTGTSI